VSGVALLVGAVGLLAVPALLLMNPGAWMLQTEGSPAGTIFFVLAGSIGFFTGLAGVACAVAAATLLAYGTSFRVSIFLVTLVIATLLAAGVARVFMARTSRGTIGAEGAAPSLALTSIKAAAGPRFLPLPSAAIHPE
jgi:hypothetical protein